MKSKIFKILIAILFVFSNNCSFAEIEQITSKSVMTYMTNMQITIKNNWKPNKYTESTSSTVRYTILANGKIKDIILTKPSNNSEMNKSAIKAIKSTKLPPLPPELAKKGSITTDFTFNYNKKD